jgi:hypothetical protein
MKIRYGDAGREDCIVGMFGCQIGCGFGSKVVEFDRRNSWIYTSDDFLGDLNGFDMSSV